MQRIEIVAERRRAYDAAFRARVVTASAAPGARVQDVARQHGVCTSLVYRWRRLMRPQAGAGSPVRLLPVRVVEADGAGKGPTTRPAEPRRAGTIEVERDGIRVRLDGEVSIATLRRVVAALRG